MANERVCANDAVLPKYVRTEVSDLLTIEARIDAFCRWFSCDQPNIERDEDGNILLADDVIEWCSDQAVSIDWIICGDPHGMASVFRDKYLAENNFMNIVKKLDKTEQALLLSAMKANADGQVPFEVAFEAFKAQVKAHRAGEAA